MLEKEQKKPARFNIMDAAGYGHYRVWKERNYLIRLAWMPFLVKFASTIIVIVYDFQMQYLKQGLIMLPSMFLIGWLMAQFLRTLLLNERWPNSIDKVSALINAQKIDKNKAFSYIIWRSRGVIASILVYVLCGFISYLFCYLLNLSIPENIGSNFSNENKPEKFLFVSVAQQFGFLALCVIGFSAFRLLWLYIPFSVLYPMRKYLNEVKGFVVTLRYMLLMFCCMAPLSFVMILIIRIVFSVIGPAGEDVGLNPSTPPIGIDIAGFLTVAIQSLSEILLGLISTAAFAWAMRSFLPRAKGTFDDFPTLTPKD